MTTRHPISDHLDPTIGQVVIRAVKIDRAWLEHHWGGRVTPARPHRPPVERRVESGLDALSISAVGAVVGL